MPARCVRLALVSTAALGAVCGASAQEKEPDWFVHAGVGQLTLEDNAEFTVGGGPLPGAGLQTDPQYTILAEIGRYFTDEIALALTIGLPPTAKADGRGAIAGLGRLAEVTYGPMALTAQYHPFRTQWFDPYVGIGASYMMIMDTKDGVLANVEAEDDFGAVLQAGATFSITETWGAFIDIKRAMLETTATGTLGGIPVESKITMDPVVLSTGLAYKF